MTIKLNTNNYFFRHSTIKPEPGIEIWYAPIPDLINFLFSEKKYSISNFKANQSVLFKESDFIPHFFAHEELQTINNFKALKKQTEWMAGRCLIKHMVLKYSSRLTSASYFDSPSYFDSTSYFDSALYPDDSVLYPDLYFNNNKNKIRSDNRLQPKTQNPKPKTQNSTPKTHNPKPKIQHPASKNQIPKRLCDITIAHHDEGAPFLEKWPFWEISISHSGKYAVTAISTIKGKKIGVDIEKIGKVPNSSFMKIAFTEKEIVNIKYYPKDRLKVSEEVFKKWTMKEAFLKYIKKGFNESLHRVEIIDDYIFHNGKKADVSIFYKIIGKGAEDRYFLSMVS